MIARVITAILAGSAATLAIHFGLAGDKLAMACYAGAGFATALMAVMPWDRPQTVRLSGVELGGVAMGPRSNRVYFERCNFDGENTDSTLSIGTGNE